MCGIYGYVGKKNAYDVVYEGLTKLQYRGYDSCGIAYFNNEFIINKTIGALDKLKPIQETPNIAFGHTRWATNGIVNIDNAHPHISFDKEYVIVHNGIIKNAENIKQKLQTKGISFYSKTDTEVIANYIADIDGVEGNVLDIFKSLEGTFSLIIGNKKGELYLLKKFSPLHLLKAEDGMYISSDISSLPSGELYSLEDNDVIKISDKNISALNKRVIKFKKWQNLSDNNELKSYKHYMLKEINETPEAIKNTYYSIKDFDATIFNHYKRLTLIGCGTAYNSCLIGEYLLENENNLQVESCLASNYHISHNIRKNHLHIIVSQSGETADCIKVAEQIRKHKGKIMVITNEPTSTIVRLSDYQLFTNAKKEIAVASTKTYCCQIFIFAYISQKLKDNNYHLNIDSLSEDLTKFIGTINIQAIIEKLKSLDRLILIGKDIDYLTLVEASLKIREIDYIYTIPMYAGELKHGTLSLVDKNAFVLTLNTGNEDRLSTAISEIRSREGNVLEIAIPKLSKEHEKFKQIYSIMPFQLISYEIAVQNGRNPDMPRNLAKSVTVE